VWCIGAHRLSVCSILVSESGLKAFENFRFGGGNVSHRVSDRLPHFQTKRVNDQWSQWIIRHSMPPPDASGDLNSHPQLSACRSPCMWMMQHIRVPLCVRGDLWRHRVCRWCGSSYSIATTEFEVRRSFPSPLSVSALIGLGNLTFDLSTSNWGHGSHPCHGIRS